MLAYSFWCSALWLLWRLLPAQRHRAVPWSGAEVFLAVLFLSPILPAVFVDLVSRLGLYPLWGVVCTLPVQVGVVLVCFRKLSGTLPYQLGLGCHALLRNGVIGLLGWFICTPVVYLTFLFAQHFYSRVLEFHPEQHPLTRFIHRDLPAIHWGLLWFTTVVSASLTEEMLFRGVLQPWLARRPWGGAAAMTVALVLAVSERLPALQANGAGGAFQQSFPALFVIALVPSYLLIGQIWRTSAARSIFATALLWAMAHSSAWPQPVGLLPLGLGLGILAYRTQSLIASILCHALFNSVGMTLLLLSTRFGS